MTLEGMIKRSQVVDLKRITDIKCTDGHLKEIFDPDLDGDGDGDGTETVTYRSGSPISGSTSEFIRLSVSSRV